MNLQEIINSGANVVLNVTPEQLNDFANTIVNSTLNSIKANEDNEANVKLITRKQAADLLGVAYGTLVNWDKSGYLNSIEVGRKRMYKETEVLERIK